MAVPTSGIIFHPGALLDIADHMDGPTVPRQYALTFLEMLQTRINRILATIGNNDAMDAMDAVLSLKVSSHMVGALSMESICAGLERNILNNDMAAAAHNARVLPDTIDILATAITEFLSHALNEPPSARWSPTATRPAAQAPCRSVHPHL